MTIRSNLAPRRGQHPNLETQSPARPPASMRPRKVVRFRLPAPHLTVPVPYIHNKQCIPRLDWRERLVNGIRRLFWPSRTREIWDTANRFRREIPNFTHSRKHLRVLITGLERANRHHCFAAVTSLAQQIAYLPGDHRFDSQELTIRLRCAKSDLRGAIGADATVMREIIRIYEERISSVFQTISDHLRKQPQTITLTAGEMNLHRVTSSIARSMGWITPHALVMLTCTPRRLLQAKAQHDKVSVKTVRKQWFTTAFSEQSALFARQRLQRELKSLEDARPGLVIHCSALSPSILALSWRLTNETPPVLERA